MDRIKAKQIEGGLDQRSEQVVSGSKEFSAPQHFPGEGTCMTLYAGHIYWCQNQGVLNEEGNTRIQALGGRLSVEVYDGGAWITP